MVLCSGFNLLSLDILSTSSPYLFTSLLRYKTSPADGVRGPTPDNEKDKVFEAVCGTDTHSRPVWNEQMSILIQQYLGLMD